MIKAENLCKTYDTLQVLDNLNLHIKAGQFCMVTGPSGTGKSTLLNVLSRLDIYQSGHLYLMGKDIGRITQKEMSLLRRKHIGFIFQSYNLISSKNCLEMWHCR